MYVCACNNHVICIASESSQTTFYCEMSIVKKILANLFLSHYYMPNTQHNVINMQPPVH